MKETALKSTRILGGAAFCAAAAVLFPAETPPIARVPAAVFLNLTLGAAAVALVILPVLLALHYRRRLNEMETAHVDTVRTMMAAVDASDPFTRGHGERIADMSLRVGKHLGMTGRRLKELEYAALTHDIGRAAIYYDVLLKPGRLDDDEKALMQTHPKVGHDIIRKLKFMEGAAEIVYSHHEQPDGRGYPRQLPAERIPGGARIIAATAAWDAMTQDRPYRRGLTAAHAIEELEAKSGTQFFPEVVKAMMELHAAGQLVPETEAERMDTHRAA